MLAAHCADGEDVLRQAQSGVGALVLTEDVVGTADMVVVEKLIQAQTTWSDLPVVVFASRAPTSLAGRELVEHTQPLGNVTVLERPVHRATLISAVHSALRARERQYEVRDLLAAHERGVRLRDEFLAMLGHELRNPLGAIRNILYAIDLRDGASDPEGPRFRPRDRALITRQVTHLTRLVDDLLDVSRVTTGKVVLKQEAVDLVDLVLRCVQSLEEMARIHGQALRFTAGSDSVVVTGDPTRLEQVTTNLLTNAIKYTPPNGSIAVRVERMREEAVLTVADTGAGLAPGMVERVFELFSQSDRTLERAQGGLGIGLTLVRALVRQHGGEVAARSPGPGLGSTFEVRLPLLRGASSPPAAPPAARGRGVAAGEAVRVLIVEDNDDNRESLVLLMEQLGHLPTAVADGPEALERLATGEYDLAIVDIGLPQMDGYELARRVRETGQVSGLYLVALTGYGQPEDRERARAAGFDDHVTKPLDLEALERLLARVKGPVLKQQEP
jgi:signal transduction histidine kinase/CheY-like chemotaxis protein